jgi:hypothetical protein
MPIHPDDGSPFFYLARTVIQQANFACGIHIEEPDRLLSHYDRVTNLLQTFTWLLAMYPHDNMAIQQWINTIVQTQNRITQYLDAIQEYDYDLADEDAAIPHAIIPEFPSIPTGGRPQISLPWNTITAYRLANYTWTEIASYLNIHPRTLLRYRERYGYQDPMPYSEITDDELDQLVYKTVEQTSGVVGTQFMCAILQDYGHKIQRQRVRQSMARVDPLGNMERWATLIPRIVYSVRGPDSLWHMDGNLKMVKYGFVLHASIDGYSRRIIYLNVNTNNRAETVLNAFLTGVQNINAIPHRVRADKGGENRDVATWMLITRGVNRGSFITGRSVHNQRIERLWRDVNRWLTTFRLIFNYLQQNNHYDPDNDVDRFSLIFIYIPLLRRSLSQFSRIWNTHKIRTEHYRTPIQLYADHNPDAFPVPLNARDLEQYGIDWEGPVPIDEDIGNSVVVEPPVNPLDDVDWNELMGRYRAQLYPAHETIENNLMTPVTNYAVDIYLDVRQWIESRIAIYNNVENI